MIEYATKEDLDKKCNEIRGEIKGIKTNDLPHLFALVDMIKDRVMTNRWVFIVSVGVLGIVLGILEVFG